MKANYKLEDVPHDVMWVWAFRATQRFCGEETMKRIDDIIDLNPKYFEWEHQHKAIPKEVHEAYDKEAFPNKFKDWEEMFSQPISQGQGLMSVIQLQMLSNDFDLIKTMKEHYNALGEAQRKKIEETKRVKLIGISTTRNTD